MSTPKKEAAKENTNMEQVQAALQALIAQGKKDGMIRLSDLNAQLEKLQLSPEKIEEIYDRFEALSIPLVTAELDRPENTRRPGRRDPPAPLPQGPSGRCPHRP